MIIFDLIDKIFGKVPNFKGRNDFVHIPYCYRVWKILI